METIKQFLDSSQERETSPKILEAIIRQSNSIRSPEDIWAGPTYLETLAVWKYVTDNGLHDDTDYMWGVYGNTWGYILNRTAAKPT